MCDSHIPPNAVTLPFGPVILSWWIMIVRVSYVLNRTFVDSD